MKKEKIIYLLVLVILLMTIGGCIFYWYQYHHIPSTRKWQIEVKDIQQAKVAEIEVQRNTMIVVLDDKGNEISNIEISDGMTEVQLPKPAENKKLLFQNWSIAFQKRDEKTKQNIYHAKPNYIDAKDFLLTVQSDEHSRLYNKEGKDVEGLVIPYTKDTEVLDYLPSVEAEEHYKGNWFYIEEDGSEVKLIPRNEIDKAQEKQDSKNPSENDSRKTKESENKSKKTEQKKDNKKSADKKQEGDSENNIKEETQKMNRVNRHTTLIFKTYQDKNNNFKDDFGEKFTVKFNTDIKDVKYKDIVVGWEENVKLPILKDKQRVFFGWSSDEKFEHPFREADKVTSDLVLYAEFRPIDEVMNRSVEQPIYRQDVAFQVLKILEINNKQVDVAYNKKIKQEEEAKKKKEEQDRKNNIFSPPKQTMIELHNVDREKLYLITFIDEYNQYRFSFVSPYGRTVKIYDGQDNLLKEYAVRHNTTIPLNTSDFVTKWEKLEGFRSEYFKFNDTIYIKISPDIKK